MFVATNGMDFIATANKMMRIVNFSMLAQVSFYWNVFHNNCIAKVPVESKVHWHFVPSVVNPGTFAEAPNSYGAEKRANTKPLSSITDAIQLSNIFSVTDLLEIYVIIFSGQELSEPFWNLPSKRYYPDYYKEIKNPLSLNQIGKKLKV